MHIVSLRLNFLLVSFFLISLSCKNPVPEDQRINVGDKVPHMTFAADDGSTVSTDSFINRWTVLYFYPKDDSPGCTIQAKTFTDMLGEYKAANAQVYGINTDSIESHIKFKKKHGLGVTLLTDPQGDTASRFGIRVVAGMCARDSVLINSDGRVEKIFRGVDPAGNPVEIIEYITTKSSTR